LKPKYRGKPSARPRPKVQSFRADPPLPSHSSQVGSSLYHCQPILSLRIPQRAQISQLYAQTADQYRPSHRCSSTVLQTRCCRFFAFVSPVQPDGQYESNRQENEVYQGMINRTSMVQWYGACQHADGVRRSVPTRGLSTATVRLPLLEACVAPGSRARVDK
jgi:hypothetical protein